MANKLKPLELADALEKNGDGCTCCAYASFECCCEAVWGSNYTHEAAAELRRLHEENVYLKKVYEDLVQDRKELFDDLDKAVAAEREACAKVCEKEQFELTQDVAGKNGLQHFDAGCRSCAEMIRRRGEV